MIFGLIKSDDKVFTGDKLRIDVSGTFLSPGITLKPAPNLHISLDAGVTYFDVSSTKYLEWIFSTAGAKVITLKVTTSDLVEHTFIKSVTCLDLTAQKLFSKDSDLYGYETEIDQYLPKKWSSWNLVHLKAQEYIIDWLDEKRIFNQNYKKYTVNDLLDREQVKQFSAAKTLELIFESNINIVGDLFTQKRDKYKLMVSEKAAKSQISLDYNENGTVEENERTDLYAVAVNRE